MALMRSGAALVCIRKLDIQINCILKSTYWSSSGCQLTCILKALLYSSVVAHPLNYFIINSYHKYVQNTPHLKYLKSFAIRKWNINMFYILSLKKFHQLALGS